MLNLEDVNILCAEIAQEESEKRIAEQYDEFLEEEFWELQRQFEAMQNAADQEDFSPFDTVNS